ncbi:hypothetical protein V8F06_006734 [Rhypophila decipiens]
MVTSQIIISPCCHGESNYAIVQTENRVNLKRIICLSVYHHEQILPNYSFHLGGPASLVNQPFLQFGRRKRKNKFGIRYVCVQVCFAEFTLPPNTQILIISSLFLFFFSFLFFPPLGRHRNQVYVCTYVRFLGE